MALEQCRRVWHSLDKVIVNFKLFQNKNKLILQLVINQNCCMNWPLHAFRLLQALNTTM